MKGLMMKYFVLKPNGKDKYAQASRKALRAYANTIYPVNEELSRDLRAWADEESPFSHTPKMGGIMND
jgi:hypothetical protein